MQSGDSRWVTPRNSRFKSMLRSFAGDLLGSDQEVNLIFIDKNCASKYPLALQPISVIALISL